MQTLDYDELFETGAVDQELYCRAFFPRTVRQASPAFHKDFWIKLEDTSFDFFGAEVFRGGGKTTLCRLTLSRRIAYALSRNILNVGVNETMAIYTNRWLKRQMENNTLWTQVFKLRPGSKWTDEYFIIEHGIEGCEIHVTAKGVTSGLRGLNLDDYRPDFILCDDICNEENTATEEGRKKINDLIFGALVPTLAPKSEVHSRKFALLNTAITKEDPIVLAHKDPTFRTVKYPKIIEREDGTLESAWPERWSLEECLAEKNAYIKRRKLYIWLREYGCKIVGSGETAFAPEWLRTYQVLPLHLETYIGIDPARSKKKRAHKSSIVVIGVDRTTGDTYILETWAQKGQNPEEIWTELLRLYLRWRPRQVGVESIAYQQMLAWYIRQKQAESRIFFPIIEVEDKRSKADRIVQAYSGLGSAGKLWAHENHIEFRGAFEEYTQDMDIDILDAGAQAICLANPWMVQGGVTVDEHGNQVDPIVLEERAYAPIELVMGAP